MDIGNKNKPANFCDIYDNFNKIKKVLEKYDLKWKSFFGSVALREMVNPDVILPEKVFGNLSLSQITLRDVDLLPLEVFGNLKIEFCLLKDINDMKSRIIKGDFISFTYNSIEDFRPLNKKIVQK